MVTLRLHVAPSFLIGSSSFLQVTNTTIKAWMCSNFGQISPLTNELATIERLNNLCDHSRAFMLDLIFIILAGHEVNHKILDDFEIWPDPTTNCVFICLKRLEKSQMIYINGGHVEANLAPSF